MLYYRYVIILLSVYLTLESFLVFFPSKILYASDIDDDKLNAKKCSEKFNSPNNENSSSDESTPKMNFTLREEPQPDFVKFFKNHSSDKQTKVREEALENLFSLIDILPKIGKNISILGEEYTKVLKYAKENIENLPVDQKIDLYLFIVMLKAQLFPDPKKSLIYYISFTDTDNIPNYKDQLLSTLNLTKDTDFSEKIDQLLKEVKNISIGSSDLIIKYLSSISKEMSSFTKLNLDKIQMDFLEEKLKLIQNYIETLCYSASIFDIINKILGPQIKFSDFYTSIIEIIEIQNALIYNYIACLTNSFVNRFKLIVGNLKNKDLISFLKLTIKYPVPFEDTLYPYSHTVEEEQVLDAWILFALTSDEFIKFTQSNLKPLEDSSKHQLSFEQLFSYFHARAKPDFLRFIHEYCRINSTDIPPKFIVSHELIGLMSTIIYWVSTRYVDYLNGKTLTHSEILSITKLIANDVVQLDSMNQFFFMWFMSYMDEVYSAFIHQKAVHLNKVLSVYTGAYIIKNFPDIAKDQLDNILDVLIPKRFIQEFVKQYSSDLQKGNLKLDAEVLYYFLIKDKYSDYLTLINFNLNKPSINLEDAFKKIYSYPHGVSAIRKLFSLLGSKITSTTSLYNVLHAIQNSMLSSEISYFLNYLDTNQFIKKNQKMNGSVLKYFFQSEDSVMSFIKRTSGKSNTNLKILAFNYLLQKDDLTHDEINFLIQNTDLPNYDPSKVEEIICSLSEPDLIQTILTNKSYFYQHQDKLIQIILSINLSILKNMDTTTVSDFVKLLINSIEKSDSFNKELTEFINKILFTRTDVLDSIRSECKGSSLDLSYIRKYMISNSFIEKEKRLLRDSSKKEQLIQKEKEGSLRASDIEELLTDFIQNEDSSIVYELLDIFDMLIDQEVEQSDSSRNGRKEFKELQKSLKLILNMFQNTSFEDKPVVKQILFLNINKKILSYLISNINSYNNIKTLVFNIISYQLDNNILIPSKDSWLIDILKELIESKQFGTKRSYELITKILNQQIVNKDTVTDLIPLLVNLLKSDTKLIKSTNNEFKILNSKNILYTLIPIISKHQELASDLLEVLKDKLSQTDSLSGIDEINIKILKINQEILNALESLPMFRRIIAMSIISSRALLSIKNASFSKKRFYFQDSLEKVDKSYPKFIYDLATSIVSRLDKTLDLRVTISQNLSKILKTKTGFATEEAKTLREQTSIYKVLLDKIESGYIPVDLSNKQYIGLGFDIFCLEDGVSNYIEVKSKMSLFSKDYPIVMTPNEIRFALHVHNDTENTKFSLYIVPLNYQERKTYGDIIDAEIDWKQLQHISDNITPYIQEGINGSILIEHFVLNLNKDTENN